jgi:lipopolysaccharide export LptBFGC system permease protein LptF
LLALPIYVIPVMAGMSPISPWVPTLEKLAATLITALSVLFLFWTLKELVTERRHS